MTNPRTFVPYKYRPAVPAAWDVFLRSHGWAEGGLIEQMQADRKVKLAVRKFVKTNLHKRFTPTAVQKFLGVYKSYEHS